MAAYEQSFGQGTTVVAAGVEIITFHLVATTARTPLFFRETPLGNADPSAALVGKRMVFFDEGLVEAPIYEHRLLVAGNKLSGPAIIEGANTTLPVHPAQEITVDSLGNLVLRFPEEPA
jgi:N-methylhydantoinase A